MVEQIWRRQLDCQSHAEAWKIAHLHSRISYGIVHTPRNTTGRDYAYLSATLLSSRVCALCLWLCSNKRKTLAITHGHQQNRCSLLCCFSSGRSAFKNAHMYRLMFGEHRVKQICPLSAPFTLGKRIIENLNWVCCCFTLTNTHSVCIFCAWIVIRNNSTQQDNSFRFRGANRHKSCCWFDTKGIKLNTNNF